MLILHFSCEQVKKVAQTSAAMVSLVMVTSPIGEIMELQDELRLALALGRLLVEDAEEYSPCRNDEAVNHNDYLVYRTPLDYLIQTGS